MNAAQKLFPAQLANLYALRQEKNPMPEEAPFRRDRTVVWLISPEGVKNSFAFYPNEARQKTEALIELGYLLIPSPSTGRLPDFGVKPNVSFIRTSAIPSAE